MRRKAILFVISIISFVYLTSCNRDHTLPEELSGAVCAVKFSINQELNIIPFPDTKSIPGDFPSEPTTSSKGGTDEESSFSFIEYAVYDTTNDALVRHITFSKEDPLLNDFGYFIYDTLRTGSYKVCLLTHSVPQTTFEDNILTFPNIGDIFNGSILAEININTQELEKTIVLRRAVSRVEFVATDIVPDKVKSLHLQSAGRYDKFDLLTGETVTEPSAYAYEHIFTPAERGEGLYNTHAFYTLVPPGENIKLSGAILTAKDQEGYEVRKRTVTDIPIIKNKITRYRGILYTPGTIDDIFDLTFENDGAWDEPIEENLPND